MPSNASPRPATAPGAGAASLLAALVVVLVGLVMFWPGVRGNAGYLLAKRHPLSSVADALAPNGSLKVTALALRSQKSACMSAVTVAPDSDIALFRLAPRVKQAHPPLALLLSARGYRSAAKLATGEYGGRVQFHLRPPQRAVIANACLLNRGPTSILLEGTTQRRYTSRSTLTIDGRPVAGNLTLSFLQNRRVSQLEGLGETFQHVSTLSDHLLPVWLIWMLIVAAMCAIPIGTVTALHRALRADEAAKAPHGATDH